MRSFKQINTQKLTVSRTLIFTQSAGDPMSMTVVSVLANWAQSAWLSEQITSSRRVYMRG